MSSVDVDEGDLTPPSDQENPTAATGLSVRQKSIIGVVVLLAVLVVALAWARAGESGNSANDQPKLPSNMFEVGLQLHQNGQYDQAMMAYRTVLETDPDSAPVHYNIGQILHVRGELAAAIGEYELALASDPALVPALYNRGLALRDQGDNLAAIASLEAALSREPNHVGALYNLGNILIAQGDPDRGTKLINRAIELDPKLLRN